MRTQAQLKSIGLYLGPIDGKWGPRSQKALADLKDFKKWQGDEWKHDDKALIFILVKIGEGQIAESEAIEAELTVPAAFSDLNNVSLPRAGKELYSRSSAPAYGYNGVERVGGYYRANGKYVEPYYRTRANSTVVDNWSTKGNVNPFTGKRGSK